MDYHFNLTGSARRPLVKALEDFTKEKATCTKAPTFCYHIGEHITLDNHGVLSVKDAEQENSILLTLSEHGFVPEEQENMAVTISLPRNKFTDENLERLSELLTSKESIIKHALGTESVAFEVDEEKISFPWFSEMPSSAELSAYTAFISLLGKAAKESKRITGKDHAVENEKYYFRCFLLRLGMIGDSYKEARKILLSRLQGSSAFKYQKEAEK